MTLRLLALVLLGLSAASTHADWQGMGGGADSELFVDADRLRRTPDGSVTFWQLEVPGNPRKAPNGKTYASISTHFGLRCEDGTYTQRTRQYHNKPDGSGTAVHSESSPTGSRWVTPSPDSDMARWLPSMCYRARVLELFEERERASRQKLDQMR